MNCKTKPLYELCYNCDEMFDTACYLCYKQGIEELKEVEMNNVLELWNKEKILNRLSIWLDDQSAIRFSFRLPGYSSWRLQIKPGGKEDNKKEHILCLVQKWMREYPIERLYIIEEHNEKLTIY